MTEPARTDTGLLLFPALEALIALYEDAWPMLQHEGHFDEPGSSAEAAAVIQAAREEAERFDPLLDMREFARRFRRS